MSDTVIKVENLSKSYLIRHQSGERYTALRDVLTNGIKSLSGRFLDPSPLAPRPSPLEEFWALNDVSFEVKQGERVGIIGRNGAGKSTLLKILSRITEPTSGRIRIKGRVASLLEVGTGFHPELTGRENIYLNGAILGMTRAEIRRKFDEIVAFAEVEKFLDTPVKRYSSGMYVRLAFAVAAHLEPEILVVDEVLAVGDAEFQKKCLGKMEDIASTEGRTIFFVSHNLQAVESLCNRGIFLQTGKVTFDNTATQAISQYYETSRSAHQVSLGERLDRTGNGRARVTSIRLCDQQGNETNQIGMGETFTVVLEIDGQLQNAMIGIHFGNMLRKYLIRGYTYEQVAEQIQIAGKNTISCQFINFPLIHGSYDIHVWLGDALTRECSDYVEHAASLDLYPKDIFKTGVVLNPHGGVAFCKALWAMNTQPLN